MTYKITRITRYSCDKKESGLSRKQALLFLEFQKTKNLELGNAVKFYAQDNDAWLVITEQDGHTVTFSMVEE